MEGLSMPKRHDPEFEAFLRDQVTLDPVTGVAKVKDVYAYLGFNIMWDGGPVSMTYANLVWFLTYGRWPKEGYNIDHINDNPLDNRPSNLQEITVEANHAKRRGRKVYRSYGTGKYGYGLGIYNDKRDNRFYITRDMSRGHGAGDLKSVKLSLGGCNTMEDAEARIKELIIEIEANGLDYRPVSPPKNTRWDSMALKARTEEIRKLRTSGNTIQQIVDATGFSHTSVYNRVRDMNIDKRLK
jgi:hypothetical protein